MRRPDRTWLRKVRPVWGHDYHFHIRMRLSGGQSDCLPQSPVAGRRRLRQGLDGWFKRSSTQAQPKEPKEPTAKPKPKPQITMMISAGLPQVLLAP